MKKLLILLLGVCLWFNSSNVPDIFAKHVDTEVEETKSELIEMTYPTIEEMVSEYESQFDYEACTEGPKKQPIPKLKPKKIPMGKFKITYYCGCYSCSEGWGTMTSTGVRAEEGRTIAVDPSVISYGTRVYIEGKGEFIAEDCGGAIKGNDIDIFLDDHDRVYRGGVDYCDVYIIND